MTDAILALNAGSSSIKFSLFSRGSDLTAIATGQIEGIGDAPRMSIHETAGAPLMEEDLAAGADHEAALARLLAWIDTHSCGLALVGAGHRVVHGGSAFAAPLRVDKAVLARLETLVPLAPLHQPHNLSAIRRLAKARPDLPQVACFDTAFHSTNPDVATHFALPRALTGEGVRRYGFHGLSYEYIAGALPEFAGAAAKGRVVVAHLGHGASMCALRDGRSLTSTMGFTALDGLPMGRRCGALDPGVVLYLMKEKQMGHEALTDLFYHRSGLFGVSGISDDMRALLASDAAEAKDAVDLFVYRIGRELGSLAAALEGLDVLVFTGGIGEHAAAIRARVCQKAEWLGVRLDAAANERGEVRISTKDSPVAVFAIPTDENLMIARHTDAVLRGAGDPASEPDQNAGDTPHLAPVRHHQGKDHRW